MRLFILLWTYHSLYITNIDEHLHCFKFLSTLNKAFMNIQVPVFVWIYVSFLLGKYLEVRLLVSVNAMFVRKDPTVFQNMVSF